MKKLILISTLFLSGCEVILVGALIDSVCDDDPDCWDAAIQGIAESGSENYDYDWDWDQFYDQYYNLVWRCRGIQTGRFADSDNCYYDTMDDDRWPSK